MPSDVLPFKEVRSWLPATTPPSLRQVSRIESALRMLRTVFRLVSMNTRAQSRYLVVRLENGVPCVAQNAAPKILMAPSSASDADRRSRDDAARAAQRIHRAQTSASSARSRSTFLPPIPKKSRNL